MKDDRYPQKCPVCNSPAWIGPMLVHCTNEYCRHYEKPKPVSAEELKRAVDEGWRLNSFSILTESAKIEGLYELLLTQGWVETGGRLYHPDTKKGPVEGPPGLRSVLDPGAKLPRGEHRPYRHRPADMGQG